MQQTAQATEEKRIEECVRMLQQEQPRSGISGRHVASAIHRVFGDEPAPKDAFSRVIQAHISSA